MLSRCIRLRDHTIGGVGTLVGKGGSGTELKLAGSEKLQLTIEVGIGEQLHRLENTAQARGGYNMCHGTVVSCQSNKRSALCGVDGRCSLPLEILDAVCIFHRKKIYLLVSRVNHLELHLIEKLWFWTNQEVSGKA